MESKNKSHKEETLEKEVAEMKIEMMKLKVELSEKLEEEIVELKKNVTELTESVKFLKRNTLDLLYKMTNNVNIDHSLVAVLLSSIFRLAERTLPISPKYMTPNEP